MSKTVHFPQNVASDYLDILNNHQCPYTQDVDDSYIGELLLSSGEQRIRLLMWIFGEIHPVADKVFHSQELMISRSTDLGVDKRIQMLTSICASIGLCRTTDMDLVRGETANKKQIWFWNKIFRLLQFSSCNALNDACEEDKTLMQKMLDVDFSNTIDLLPHDLKQQMKKEHHMAKQLTRRSFREIEEDLKKFSEKLEVQCQKIEGNFKYLDTEEDSLDYTISRSLLLNLNDLDQMMTTFDQVFVNSLETFCDRKVDSFGKLGKTVEIVNRQLNYVLDVLKSLHDIKCCNEFIVECRNNIPGTNKKVLGVSSIFSVFWSDTISTLEESNYAKSEQKHFGTDTN